MIRVNLFLFVFFSFPFLRGVSREFKTRGRHIVTRISRSSTKKGGCEGRKGQVHSDAPITGIEILTYILHHF